MKRGSKIARSLSKTLSLAVIVPGAVVFAGVLALCLYVAWRDTALAANQARLQLEKSAELAARRVAAELLLGPQGEVSAALEVLKLDLHLSNIVVIRAEECVSGKTSFAYVTSAHSVCVLVPYVQAKTWVRATSTSPGLIASLDAIRLSIGAAAFVLALALGLLGQRRAFLRDFIHPIEQLLKTEESTDVAIEAWPKELQELSARLQAALMAKEQAVYASLVRGVVHDIRTQMHGLAIATELADDPRLQSPQRLARLESLLSTCKRNVPKLRNIVEQTLASGRALDLRIQPASISKTVNEALTANASYAAAQGVVVATSVETSSDLVPHDPLQLERALSNVIRNAIEAAASSFPKQGGARVAVGVEVDPLTAKVTVDDSGPGMSALGVESTKANGFGLGLQIARRIASAHQGVIEIARSPILGGARFTLCIPVSRG